MLETFVQQIQFLNNQNINLLQIRNSCVFPEKIYKRRFKIQQRINLIHEFIGEVYVQSVHCDGAVTQSLFYLLFVLFFDGTDEVKQEVADDFLGLCFDQGFWGVLGFEEFEMQDVSEFVEVVGLLA